jgi:hypothetical protein
MIDTEARATRKLKESLLRRSKAKMGHDGHGRHPLGFGCQEQALMQVFRGPALVATLPLGQADFLLLAVAAFQKSNRITTAKLVH